MLAEAVSSATLFSAPLHMLGGVGRCWSIMHIQAFLSFFNFLQEDNPHICHGTKEIKTYIFSVLSTQSAKSRTIVSLRNMINTCGFGFLLTLWSSAHRGRLLQLHVKEMKDGCSWNCSEPKKVAHVSVTATALPYQRHWLLTWLPKLASLASQTAARCQPMAAYELAS